MNLEEFHQLKQNPLRREWLEVQHEIGPLCVPKETFPENTTVYSFTNNFKIRCGGREFVVIEVEETSDGFIFTLGPEVYDEYKYRYLKDY